MNRNERGFFAFLVCSLFFTRSFVLAQTSPGEPVKNFSFKTMKGEKGNLKNVSGGKIFLLSFMGKDPASKHQAQILQKVVQSQGAAKNVAVMGVLKSFDSQEAAVFAQEAGITYPLVEDAKREVFNDYGIHQTPVILVVDPNGRVRKVILSSGNDAEQFVLDAVNFVYDNYVKPPKVKTNVKHKKDFDPKELKINRIPELKDAKKTKQDTIKTGDVIKEGR